MGIRIERNIAQRMDVAAVSDAQHFMMRARENAVVDVSVLPGSEHADTEIGRVNRRIDFCVRGVEHAVVRAIWVCVIGIKLNCHQARGKTGIGVEIGENARGVQIRREHLRAGIERVQIPIQVGHKIARSVVGSIGRFRSA